ncbi:MAG: hypothetical protein JW855_04195 [Gammaproteobacteria bacterium]|nr:hypothetical protein [Gammaproteobacteria bacterium]
MFRFRSSIYQENMNSLIIEKYPYITELSETLSTIIISQLRWVQENPEFTPQADSLYEENGEWQLQIHREIFRALSSIENLLLLRRVGGLSSTGESINIDEETKELLYRQFMQEQPETSRLSRESFESLVTWACDLSAEEVEAQIRARLIAAVALSPAAKKILKRLSIENYPEDGVPFSTFTMDVCPNIYPCFSSASESVQALMKTFFFPAHWRHAFFLENSSCLSNLLHQIREGNISEETVRRWENYWTVNLLGFNGHIGSLTGSAFMTESVYQRSQFLNQAMSQYLENPETDILHTYCQSCLQYLGIEIGASNLAIYLVRLMLLTNLFNPNFAKKFKKYLEEELISQTIQTHYEVFASHKTATYLPAFFQNIVDVLSQMELQSDLRPTLIEAMDWLNHTINQSQNSNISFRRMGKKEVKKLIEKRFSCDGEINEHGEVIILENGGPAMRAQKI